MFEGCLYFNTSALVRQLERKWSAAFAPFGLTPPQAFLLRTVLKHPGLAPFELAETLSLARPTVTRLIDGLESKDLLVRKGSASDGRGQSIHPTSAALAIGDAINQASSNVTRQLKRVLGDEDFGDAVARIRRVRSSLE
ncbi:MarR family transcriptional regulator [Luteimonas viscosa]|uniref:MarR family transcriptional regulator n=1 Tax=Luteimonas viscosa TaxID=1132694 RepID=A0A5D4XQL5_9GAMM|nr:MarR family transcriptional regulator [Luteimonas viscosa]TYT26978.1 MarR family transcriptional regulator [Luteimonas viscosa]